MTAALSQDKTVTALINSWRSGESGAEATINFLYRELRRIANRNLGSERKGLSIQPTELVHEVFLKLSSGADVKYNDRAHFFAVAAKSMRRILVDRGRARRAIKRGSGNVLVSIEEGRLPGASVTDWSELDRALTDLERLDDRAAKVVEMRFFGGMSEREIAQVLGVNERTIKRDWQWARAWLAAQLNRSEGGGNAS